VGWKGSYELKDNNEWGGKAGIDMKRIMSGVERLWL
jgi:hypothetical protein